MIAVACDEDGVVAIDVAEGQRNDAPLAKGVLIEARDAVGGAAEVLGDKGFDSDAVRDVVLDDLDALPVIPNRRNRKEPCPGTTRCARPTGIGTASSGRSPRRSSSAASPREAQGRLPRRGPPRLRFHPRPQARSIRQHGLATAPARGSSSGC